MAFAEDLSPFFADFGIAATVGGVGVVGIFDSAYATALDIGGSEPAFTCPASAVTNAVAGTAVTIGSTAYTIAGPIQLDGTGMAILRLREA